MVLVDKDDFERQFVMDNVHTYSTGMEEGMLIAMAIL